MHHVMRLAVALLSPAMCACGSSGNSPTQPSTQAIPITTADRLEWQQPAPSLQEARSYTYVIYVDNVRRVLNSVVCVEASARVMCTTGVPALAAGQHVLALAAVDAGSGEGPRSEPLLVIVANP